MKVPKALLMLFALVFAAKSFSQCSICSTPAAPVEYGGAFTATQYKGTILQLWAATPSVAICERDWYKVIGTDTISLGTGDTLSVVTDTTCKYIARNKNTCSGTNYYSSFVIMGNITVVDTGTAPASFIGVNSATICSGTPTDIMLYTPTGAGFQYLRGDTPNVSGSISGTSFNGPLSITLTNNTGSSQVVRILIRPYKTSPTYYTDNKVIYVTVLPSSAPSGNHCFAPSKPIPVLNPNVGFVAAKGSLLALTADTTVVADSVQWFKVVGNDTTYAGQGYTLFAIADTTCKVLARSVNACNCSSSSIYYSSFTQMTNFTVTSSYTPSPLRLGSFIDTIASGTQIDVYPLIDSGSFDYFWLYRDNANVTGGTTSGATGALNWGFTFTNTTSVPQRVRFKFLSSSNSSGACFGNMVMGYVVVLPSTSTAPAGNHCIAPQIPNGVLTHGTALYYVKGAVANLDLGSNFGISSLLADSLDWYKVRWPGDTTYLGNSYPINTTMDTPCSIFTISKNVCYWSDSSKHIYRSGLSQIANVNVASGTDPVVSITNNNLSLCNGKPSNMHVSNASGIGVNWVRDNTWLSGSATKVAGKLNGTINNPYTVLLTDTLTDTVRTIQPVHFEAHAFVTISGRSYRGSSALATVTAYPSCSTWTNNTISIHPALDSICSGDTATLIADTLACYGGTRYVWSTGDTTRSIRKTAAGTYTVTATNVCGCSATASGTVVIKSSPTSSVSNQSIQSGSVATLVANGGISYLWNTGETTASIRTFIAGIYTVRVTNAGGCSIVVSDTVTVNIDSTTSSSGSSSGDGGGDWLSAIILTGGNNDFISFANSISNEQSDKGITLYLTQDTINTSGDSTHSQASIVIEDPSGAFVIGLTSFGLNDLSNLAISTGSPLQVPKTIPFYLFSPGNGVLYSFYQNQYSVISTPDGINSGDIISAFAYNGKIEFRKANTISGSNYYSLAFNPISLSINNTKLVSEVGSIDPGIFFVYNASMTLQSPVLEESYNLNPDQYIDITNIGFIMANDYQSFFDNTINSPIVYTGMSDIYCNDQGPSGPYNHIFPDGTQGSAWIPPMDSTYSVIVVDSNSDSTHRSIDIGQTVFWDGMYNAINPNRNLGVVQMSGTPQYGNGSDRFAVGANIIQAGTDGYVDYQIYTSEIQLNDDNSYVYFGLNTTDVFSPGSSPPGFYISLNRQLSLLFKQYGSNFSNSISARSSIGKLKPGLHVVRFKKNGSTITVSLNGMPLGSIVMQNDVDLRPVIITKYAGTGENVLFLPVITSATNWDVCTSKVGPTAISYVSTPIDENGNAIIHIDSPQIRYQWADTPSFSISSISNIAAIIAAAQSGDSGIYAHFYPSAQYTPVAIPSNLPITRPFNNSEEGIYKMMIQDQNQQCFSQSMDINIGSEIKFLSSTENSTSSIAQMNQESEFFMSMGTAENITVQFFNQGQVNKSFFVSGRPIGDDENARFILQANIDGGTMTFGFIKADTPTINSAILFSDSVGGDTTIYDYRIYVTPTCDSTGSVIVTGSPKLTIIGSLDLSSDSPILAVKIGDFILFIQDEPIAYALWPKGQGGLYAGATMHSAQVITALAAYKKSSQLIKP